VAGKAIKAGVNFFRGRFEIAGPGRWLLSKDIVNQLKWMNESDNPKRWLWRISDLNRWAICV